MPKKEELEKKVVRLKKKLAGIKKNALEKADKTGQDSSLRLWHKRLKRAQRKKKSIELEMVHMQNKKAKKKTGDEGKTAAESQESAA